MTYSLFEIILLKSVRMIIYRKTFSEKFNAVMYPKLKSNSMLINEYDKEITKNNT